MRGVAKEVVDERRASNSDKKDVLYHMLYSKDPITKAQMSEENIIDNMVTFLVAGMGRLTSLSCLAVNVDNIRIGHETTSGLLCFLTYYLISNPDKLDKARVRTLVPAFLLSPPFARHRLPLVPACPPSPTSPT